MCSRVPPASVYKGARGEAASQEEGAPGGVLLPLGLGLLLFLVGVGEGRKGERRRRKKGDTAPFLVQFGLERERAHNCPGRPSSSPTKAHEAQLTPRGVPVTPRYSGMRPKPFGTLPVSKHSRPIYRPLCLDHFKTPLHVRDHIRDSELPSVHQNT